MRPAVIGALIVAGLLGTPLSSAAETGAAAYYGSGYGPGDWLAICEQHASWGEAAAPCVWSDYWCVRPGYLPGEWLTLSANGVTLTCEIGDTVQPGHVDDWWASWVVELNWYAFVDLGLVDNNVVTVGWADDTPVVEPPPPAPESRWFAETGFTLAGDFLNFWDANGGLAVFGYPLTDPYTDQASGLLMQYTERARFEYHDDCGCVMLGRLGAEQLGR